MLLTADELAELTGYKQPARQIRWLTQHAYRFEVGGDDLPKVAKGYADARLGVPAEKRRGPKLDGLSRGTKANKDAEVAA